VNKKLAIIAVICTASIILGGINTSMLYGTSFLESKPGYSFAVSDAADWWNCSWSYCKRIAIDHTKVQSDQTDFPVLLYRSSDSDLATYAQSDGDDIAFVNEHNSTQHEHEIEEYNSATGELVAWVKVPSLSSTEDTILYMYYGNPNCGSQQNITETWNSNYIMVQHLSESAGTIYDSTSYDNDGTNSGASPNSSAKIDGGYDFDGNDQINSGANNSLNTTSQITLEGWVKDPPLFEEKQDNNIYIVDKRDEKLPVIPGKSFTVSRTIAADYPTDTIFVTLFSPGIMIKDMSIEGFSVFADYYTVGSVKSDEGIIIESIRNSLPKRMKELKMVAYSKPFTVEDDEVEIEMTFEIEKINNLLDNGRISYLAFSSDTCYDFEATTHLSYPLGLADWLNPFSIFESIIDFLTEQDSIDDATGGLTDETFVPTKQHNGIINQAVERTEPQISKQAYDIVIETSEHLDEDRGFISDIYDEVYQLDDIWSETIPTGHYIRVTFEIPLDNTRDITLYPRIISGTPRIEVYEVDGNEIIAEFDSLTSYEFNKVYLSGLNGSQDTYDLLVLDGDIEVDYIVDPRPAPTFVQFAEASDTDNPSATINKPAGTVDDDLMFAILISATGSDNDGSEMTSAPAGWTEEHDYINTATSGQHVYIYWKIASSEGASYTWTWTDAGCSWVGQIMTFRGVDTSDPIHVEGTVNQESSSSPMMPSVTTTVDNSMILIYGMCDDDDADADGGGCPETWIDTTETAGDYGTGLSTAYFVQVSQGATGNQDWTFDASEENSGQQYALMPANTFPNQSGEAPTNGSIDIGLNPDLYVLVTDTDGEAMNATWWSNSSGSWVQFAYNNSIANNTNITQSTSNFTNYSTTYWWSVNLTDGEDWSNETYHFTTESWSNNNPVNSNPSPSNESTGQNLNPTLSIKVDDADYANQTVNVTFRTNASGPWADIGSNTSVDPTASGVTLDQTPSNMNTYNTKYWWSVNTSDGAGGWDNNTYHFTTGSGLPTVTTNTSTGVEETNATLNGWLQFNGSADTTCGFRFGTSSGSYSENFSVGITANGAEFSNNNSSLTPGQLYYYQAWASNSNGFSNGTEMTFLTKPNVTIAGSFTAQTNSSSVIYITWTGGTGANNTYIERNASGETVWTRGAGTTIYNGSDNNYEDTGLTEGVTYYYQAWSFANWTYNPTLDQWSDDNASASNTTVPMDTSVDTISPYIVTSSPLALNATGDSDLDNVTLYYRWSTDNASWDYSKLIKRIQTDEISLTGDDTVNLTYAVNQSSSFLTGTSRGGGDTPASAHVRLYWVDSDTIGFDTEDATQKYVRWWVVEFDESANAFVEHINETLDAGTVNTDLSQAVNQTESWIIYNGLVTSGSTWGNDDSASVVFLDDDTITWTISGSASQVASAEVVWLPNSFVEHNEVNGWGTATNDLALTHSFDNNRTILFSSYDDGSNLDPGEYAWWGNLTTPTNIRMTRTGTVAIDTISVFVVELPSSVSVQRELIQFGASETQTSLSIDEVNTSNSFVIGFGGGYGDIHTSGGLSTETEDDTTTSTATIKFNSSTEVNLERTDTGGGSFVLDMYVTVIEFTEPSWNEWNNANNPDTESPWGWSFDFPNGTGYYEFYSVSNESGSPNESAPSSADAICRLNRIPTITDEGPSNESTDMPLTLQMNITVNDTDEEAMTITWYSNSSGSWQVFGTNTSISNGTYHQTNSNFSDYNTTYWWNITVSDGLHTNTSATFHFTTTASEIPTVVTNTSTGVEETNATLNGWLQKNGSLDATCGFRFGTSSGSYSENFSVGIIANGAEFSNNNSSLTPGQIYYYQAWGSNSLGFVNGSEMTFLTKPNPPTGLTAKANSSSVIYLTWSTGTGYNTTYIERNASGDTVWARGAGTEIYNNTGAFYEDTGLNGGTTYYYQAWSYANWTYNPTLEQWSDDNASANSTTNNPPTQSGEVPNNGSSDISIEPYMYVNCSDSDDDTLNATWWSNSSGAWVQFGSNETSFASGTNISQNNSNFSGYLVTYWWSINLTDGTDWNNETYYFTTEAINTSVDTISPYIVTSSPLALNATGDSDLDNVTLYYRWSDDNVSWGGFDTITFVDSAEASATNNPTATINKPAGTVDDDLMFAILMD